jgi:hypothetical protein
MKAGVSGETAEFPPSPAARAESSAFPLARFQLLELGVDPGFIKQPRTNMLSIRCKFAL